MHKIVKFIKRYLFLISVVILSLPTYLRMFKQGIFSMQDFHYFRLVEFGKCFNDLQIPCRWSTNSGLGYGEPLFNFYGQISYLLGELIRIVGFSYIDSLKILFILSLLGSGVFMFILSKSIWKSNWAGLISAVLYMYGPYRAVDVWVRGALPEALSFVIFPLVILFLERWYKNKKLKYLVYFSFLVAGLIGIHNLSFVMFLPFLFVWIIFRYWKEKRLKKFIFAPLIFFVFGVLMVSFYILPVIFESKFINLDAAATINYFDFRGHFITLGQILFSRYWGYGASVFGSEDGLNLSIGFAQWILPLIILTYGFISKKNISKIFILFLIGWFYLFLSHNRSTFIWEVIPFMKYIQFPWRFLGMALFSFSLCAGGIVLVNKKWIKLLFFIFAVLSIISTFGYFKEDLWFRVNDNDLTNRESIKSQSLGSIKDYWPRSAGQVPTSFAPDAFENQILLEKRSNYYKYYVFSNREGKVVFPVVYFPGWKIIINGESQDLWSGKNMGLIETEIKSGKNIVELKFTDTFVRTIGNTISAIIFLFGLFLLAKYSYEKK